MKKKIYYALTAIIAVYAILYIPIMKLLDSILKNRSKGAGGFYIVDTSSATAFKVGILVIIIVTFIKFCLMNNIEHDKNFKLDIFFWIVFSILIFVLRTMTATF